MSESPPDDELRALIAFEKSAIVDPGPARDHLAERLAPLFAPAVISPDLAPPRLSGWRLAALGVGTFVVGGATGAVIHAMTAVPRTEVRYVDRIVEVARSHDGGVAESSASSAPSAHAAVPTPSERPTRVERALPTAAAATSASSPSTVTSDETLARERQVIEKARSALARGDAEGALAATSEHTKAFPRGQLGEAREAIAVQALVRTGRKEDAHARAERFHRTYPGSMYSSVVDAAILQIP